jgi:hypothetical protein
VASVPPSQLRLSDRPVAEWFREQLELRFSDAVARASVIERRYEIAGSRVLLRFAGPAMLDRLASAFGHLTAEPEGPVSLTVNIWDSATTGTEAPPQFGEPVEVAAENGFAGAVFYHESGGLQALARWRTLAALDSNDDVAWFWAPDPALMLSWDWAYPIRPILDWWLGRQGIVLTHGGGVGGPDGGVAIVGPGGSGKSTSTLSAVGSLLKYAGDDQIAVRTTDSPWLYSVYSSGKLGDFHVERFPELAAGIVNPDHTAIEKGVTYVEEQVPGSTIRGFSLRAILIPKVVLGREEPRLVPISALASLAAIAPSTILAAPPHRPEALAALADLARALPSFQLELGSNLELIPEAIAELLER